MVNPVTKKDIDEASKAVKGATDENKKIQTKYQKAAVDLAGAIKDKNESMVKLYRPQLEKVAKEIADCIGDVERAISLVEGLREDDAFMEKSFDQVERLLAGVSKIRTTLTKQLVDSKKLDQQAVKALDALQGDEEDATSEYAHLEDVGNDLEARLDKLRPLLKKHFDAAKKAIADKDQPALTKARVALLDMEIGKLKTTAMANMPKVEAFKKKYPASELKTEATWLHDKLEMLRSTFEGFEREILDLVRLGQIATGDESERGGGSKADVAKAAKVLGIQGKDEKKLAKVLAGRPNTYERALAELAEDLELEERSGKKLVAKLEKAKVLVG